MVAYAIVSLASVAAHLLFGIVAWYVVVAKYSADRKLTFRAGPTSPNQAERAIEHRAQLQQKTQNKSALANVPSRILSAGAAKVELPPLPSLPRPEQGAPKMAAAGGATFGATTGAIAAVGGTGTGAAINFFGIRDASTNVVIVIDVSDSMFGRTGDVDYKTRKLVRSGEQQNFQAVRDEAIKHIQSSGDALRHRAFLRRSVRLAIRIGACNRREQEAAIEHSDESRLSQSAEAQEPSRRDAA
jgi:hypothetical protein